MILDRSRLGREAGRTLRLAGPLIGGQLAYLGMNVIDTVMAGHLSATTLAAVALGSSLWSALNLFLIGVLLAVPSFVSQYEGEADLERPEADLERPEAARGRITPFLHQSGWIALGLALGAVVLAWLAEPVLWLMEVEAGLIPIVTGYLRALSWGIPGWVLYLLLRFLSEGLGASRPTLYFGLLGLPVNALANAVLMYGWGPVPALGAVGCGHATSLVWWLQGLGVVVYVLRHPRYRSLELFRRPSPPRWGQLREILAVGVPIGVAIFLEGSLFTVVALIMGSLGTLTMAGHQVALNFAALTFMVPLGLSMAVTVRVGNAVGRRDTDGVLAAGLAGLGLALGTQSVSALVMLGFPRIIADVYTDDPRVIGVAVNLLFLAAVFQLSDGLQVAAAGALRGLKDTRLPMILTAVAYWVVGLPVGWWLAFRGVPGSPPLGAPGLWIGLIAGLTVAAVLLVGRFLAVARAFRERYPPDPGPPAAD